MRHMNSPSEGLDIGTCRPGARPRRGFTLVELLVVVAVIALLVGVLVPALAGARGAAIQAKEANNLRQIGLANAAYCDSTGRYLNTRSKPGEPQQNFLKRWRAIPGLWDYTDGNREIFLSPGAALRGVSFTNPEILVEVAKGPIKPCAKFKTGYSMEDYVRKGDDTSMITYDTKSFAYDWQKDIVNEYFVNDSILTRYGTNGQSIPPGDRGISIKDSGIAGRLVGTVLHPDAVVLFAMSDEPFKGSQVPSINKWYPMYKNGNYFLMGDYSVIQMQPEQFNGPDKYGSEAPFYNWGHYYSTFSQN